MRIEVRGNPNQPGEVVAAGGVSAVAAPGAEFGLAADAPEAMRASQAGGRGFPSAHNPLFARVVVNRLWQAHFGTGLVETPERPRLQRRPPFPSRAARLAGLGDRDPRLELEGDAPADRHVGRLSAVVAIGPGGPQARRRQSPALAEVAGAAGGRDGPRRDARGFRRARYEARRPELSRPRNSQGTGHRRHPLHCQGSGGRRASTGGRCTGPGSAAAAAACSTHSTAPTRRPRRPAARSRRRPCKHFR